MSDRLAARPSVEPPTLGTPAIARGTVGDVEPEGYDVSVAADQPAWQRDAVSVSARVRALLATLRPAVVQVLTFWDHVVRSVRVGNRVVEVDPSGCYRVR